MDGRFAERNKKSTPRIEWRKLFAEVEAIAGGTFCPVKRRPPKGGEKERKRERERGWRKMEKMGGFGRGAEEAEGESEEGKNVAQF